MIKLLLIPFGLLHKGLKAMQPKKHEWISFFVFIVSVLSFLYWICPKG
jgi:uncharacterized protein with PQ loop repeat